MSADKAGGVSKFDLVVAVEGNQELLVGLFVQDVLLNVVKDHVFDAVGPNIEVFPL